MIRNGRKELGEIILSKLAVSLVLSRAKGLNQQFKIEWAIELIIRENILRDP